MALMQGKTSAQENLVEKTAEFISRSILSQLKLDKNVLFLICGGSAISVAVDASKILEKFTHQNLTIMLTDERYGSVGHADSNWHQLLDKGFSLPQARLIPVLTGDDFDTTTEKFRQTLEEEFVKNSYKIGLFGIGADGHTAGILPGSDAVNSQELAYNYKAGKFERITITPKAILELDQVVVFAKGEDKWKTLEELKTIKDIHEQPAQILKVVPLLTIFTDYPKQE